MRNIKSLSFLIFFLSASASPLIGFSLSQGGSGACSWHGGINCSAGRQSSGTVRCNDGWSESVVEYDFVKMCQQKSVEDIILDEFFRDQRDIGFDSSYKEKLRDMRAKGPTLEMDMATYVKGRDEYVGYLAGLIDEAEKNMMNTDLTQPGVGDRMQQHLDYLYRLKGRHTKRYVDYIRDERAEFNKEYQTLIDNPVCPVNSKLMSFSPLTNSSNGTRWCICDEGYYNYKTQGIERQGYCQKGNPPFRIDKLTMGIDQSSAGSHKTPIPLSCPAWNVLKNGECVPAKTNDQICKDGYPNSFFTGVLNDKGWATCDCKTGYNWNATQTACVPLPVSNSQLSKAIVSTLKRGSRGSDVQHLQETLRRLGFFQDYATGYFGSVTEQAVREYQRSKGLETVGIVGPKTRSLLNQVSAN